MKLRQWFSVRETRVIYCRVPIREQRQVGVKSCRLQTRRQWTRKTIHEFANNDREEHQSQIKARKSVERRYGWQMLEDLAFQ
jgi:hypothetical protein